MRDIIAIMLIAVVFSLVAIIFLPRPSETPEEEDPASEPLPPRPAITREELRPDTDAPTTSRLLMEYMNDAFWDRAPAAIVLEPVPERFEPVPDLYGSPLGPAVERIRPARNRSGISSRISLSQLNFEARRILLLLVFSLVLSSAFFSYNSYVWTISIIAFLARKFPKDALAFPEYLFAVGTTVTFSEFFLPLPNNYVDITCLN